jgi:tungstate transport system ATP-binding protein
MKIYNVKKSFDKFSLHIESLEIPEGKIYGIIGPNGCGKTTAMKLMAGVLQPDSGFIDYEGLTPRDITMIFRKPYLLHDTVLRNLIYPLKLRKITPDMEKIEHLLEISGLSELRNDYALNLSGGEQQKLSLIRALAFSPKLIFIDEGFSHMDIESVAFFEEYILNHSNRSDGSCDPSPGDSPSGTRTFVIISHQLSTIKRLCEHVFFIHNGMVKASGTTGSILESPENDDLKKYLQYI